MFVTFPTSECIDTLISFLHVMETECFLLWIFSTALLLSTIHHHHAPSQAMTDQLSTTLFCSRAGAHLQKRHYQRVAVDSLRSDGADTSIVRVHTKAF